MLCFPQIQKKLKNSSQLNRLMPIDLDRLYYNRDSVGEYRREI